VVLKNRLGNLLDLGPGCFPRRIPLDESLEVPLGSFRGVYGRCLAIEEVDNVRASIGAYQENKIVRQRP
jgi:hypothetical protein